MIYVTKRCGNCGETIVPRHIESWSHITKIGIPFTECPYCGSINVDKHIKEYTMLNAFDYVSMCVPSIFSGFFWGMLLTFIYIEIFQDNFSQIIAWTIFEQTMLITTIIGIKRDIKEITEKIEESKERLENIEYKTEIEKLIK